ncbi:MAG TPA: hypothetical protein DD733_01585 [Clostridiales bacterium]|nr:hypothetical protein [Eubacteriales bacterium]HBR30753.1 hypothetical protein [Clostridiales bacterium]
MKNKDFIKKSIEENIVDHKAVLNNLKARALTAETKKSSEVLHGIWLRRGALVLSLLLITSMGVYGLANLYGSDKITPMKFCSSDIVEESTLFSNSSPCDSMADEDLSESTVSCGDESEETDDWSRQPSGESVVVEHTTELSEQDALFFTTFAEEYSVFQTLAYANLKYDSDLYYNGYAPVDDERFGSLKDIKEYLYSFLTRDSAGDIYSDLTGGNLPVYYEKDNLLFMLIDNTTENVAVILPETARQVVKTDDYLEIRAYKQPGESDFTYFYDFCFEKDADGRWLYKYDPDEIDPL